MGIIGSIVIGLLAGLAARFLMPGPNPGGLIVTIILGIAGAFVATLIGQTLGWYASGEAAGFVGAVIGALIILFVYRLFVTRS